MIAVERPVRAGLRRRLALVVSVVLAVLGVAVLLIAVTTSRTGPPQPGADAAGSFAASSVQTAGEPTGTSTTAEATTPVSEPRTTVESSSAPSPPPPSTPAAPPAPAATTLLLPAATPTGLSIPAIGVNSTLLDLGLNADGTIQVPSLEDPDSKAGWFDRSPSPGTQGPSIILGHIDSRKYGPGVFYDLGALLPGDTVEVTRDDGTVAVFTVDSVRSYPKDSFPTVEVYQNLDHAGLRLITCGGTFDPAKSSYENNIVAFASLTATRAA